MQYHPDTSSYILQPIVHSKMGITWRLTVACLCAVSVAGEAPSTPVPTGPAVTNIVLAGAYGNLVSALPGDLP